MLVLQKLAGKELTFQVQVKTPKIKVPSITALVVVKLPKVWMETPLEAVVPSMVKLLPALILNTVSPETLTLPMVSKVTAPLLNTTVLLLMICKPAMLGFTSTFTVAVTPSKKTVSLTVGTPLAQLAGSDQLLDISEPVQKLTEASAHRDINVKQSRKQIFFIRRFEG